MALGGWLGGFQGLVIGVAASKLMDYPVLAWAVARHGLWLPGLDLAAFRRRFGCDLLAANETLVDELVVAGLLHREEGRLRPSVRGLAIADGLAIRFELPAKLKSNP